jgi:hypothetical protein
VSMPRGKWQRAALGAVARAVDGLPPRNVVEQALVAEGVSDSKSRSNATRALASLIADGRVVEVDGVCSLPGDPLADALH